MSTTLKVKAFYADLTNDIEVAKFPEDFADWLREEGRDEDARQFLITCKNWEEVTPTYEQDIKGLIEIAEEYAPVVDFNDEIRSPNRTRSYHDAIELLRDLERVDEPNSDDEPLTWDREADLINRMLVDEVPEIYEEPVLAHEYLDVDVYVDDDDTISSVMLKTFVALLVAGYEVGAREFILDLRTVIRRGPITLDMFTLAWQYVNLLPEVGSRAEHRMMARN